MKHPRHALIAALCCGAWALVVVDVGAQEADTYEVTLTTIDRDQFEVCFEFLDIGVLRITDSEGVGAFVWSPPNNGKSKKSFLATADAVCVNTPDAQPSCSYAISGKFAGGGKTIKGDLFAADFFQATYKGKRVNACSILPATPVMSFQGTVAGPELSGKLEVTVQGAASRFGRSVGSRVDLPATAVFRLVAGDIARMFGLFDSRTQALILRGAGYSLEGAVVGQLLSGTYSAPNGTSGTFSAVNTQESPATTYGGSYSGDQSGVFNMAVSANGSVVGAWAGGGDSGQFTGQVVGNTITIGDGFAMANGTIQGNKVSGTWTEGNASGTWSGSTACR